MPQHTEKGFLEGLGLNSRDEADVVSAERDSLLNKVEAARRAQGRTAGRGLAGLISGAGSIITNRSFKGVGAAIGKGFKEAKEADVARATGLTVEQLRGRREIRNLRSTGVEGSFASRINLAKRIASIANRSGDTEIVGKALKRVTDLRTEQEEWDKLQAETTIKEIEADVEDITDAFYDGEPMTGVNAEDEDGNKGLNFVLDGKDVFRKYGDVLKRDLGDLLIPSEVLRKQVTTKAKNELRSLVAVSAQHLRKSKRVMSMLVDANIIGNLPETLSTAGAFDIWIDRTTANIGGIVGVVAGASTWAKDKLAHKDWRGYKAWTESARKGQGDIWDKLVLPAFARQTAAAAENYRSQILDLAYLAARLAEPSNRGLSDKDIQAALVRIVGDSANPQTIMTRFAEHVVDGAVNLQVMLSSHYGSYGPNVTDEDVDLFFGGEALKQYRRDIFDMGIAFGFTSDNNGRITFGTTIDQAQQPLASDQGGVGIGGGAFATLNAETQRRVDSGEILLFNGPQTRRINAILQSGGTPPEGADTLEDILTSNEEVDDLLGSSGVQ